ncbi:MAG: hypothetical protein GXY18_07180 [Methanomicrobiales archaeon]|jgi:hypothetical protein|nr:hypothetical protein [Methanomicrobiales archaeon]
MDGSMLQALTDPIIILFIFCTIVAILGSFLRSWILSCLLILLISLLVIIIAITAGQVAGLEEQIRYYITAHYVFFSTITLTLRDIILTIIIILAFQLALAFHITKVDDEFQKKFFWLPERKCCHYEMEHTFKVLSEKMKGKKRK